MERCYFTFRSVTPAQRAEQVLRRRGYQCSLMRAPKWLGQRSCAYALRLRGEEAGACTEILEAAGIRAEQRLCREEGKR